MNMKLEFLADHPQLIPEISEMKFKQYRHLAPTNTLADYNRWLERELNKQELPIAYVLIDKGAFIGTVSLRVQDLRSHDHLTPWIGNLFVHPQARNQGVGTYLMEQMRLVAKGMGYSMIYLYTSEQAEWYSKKGWVFLESTFLKGTPITVMSLTVI